MTPKLVLAAAGLAVGLAAAVTRTVRHDRACRRIAREWVAEHPR